MLSITIPGQESYDEASGEFLFMDSMPLQLEHSLVSMSKWESKWCIPFLSNQGFTDEQLLDYINMMILPSEISPAILKRLKQQQLEQISDYIAAPMTATTFRNQRPSSNLEIVTSELVYYWMIEANIPFECQYWHLNRLFTLIRVCGLKRNPEANKMSAADIAAQNRALNEERRRKLGTRG